MGAMSQPDRYLIEAAARALDVLELFQDRDEVRLADVVENLGMVKSTAFRLLYTLEAKGYIERSGSGKSYRKRRRFRIGFLSVSPEIPFINEVDCSIEAETRKSGMGLLLRHHRFDGTRLIAEAEGLLRQGVAALLCYNPDEHLSHVIADRCCSAGIPLFAITFPIPGARLFGINNYRAGLSGGEGLGEQISRRWSGHVDRLVLLDIPGSSPAQKARNTGMIEGLRRNARVPDSRILHLHADRKDDGEISPMRRVLSEFPKDRRIAVLCYNDLTALGALRAAEEAGRADHVAILSQGAVTEVRKQLRKPGSSLWSAVAHFPERFGERLIPNVLRLLQGEETPQTIYTEHVLLTRANLDRYYPSPGRL